MEHPEYQWASPAVTEPPDPDDHTLVDEPYTWGRTSTTRAPFPFTERQLARLMVLRGRYREGQRQS
jgi:hypothetical protein